MPIIKEECDTIILNLFPTSTLNGDKKLAYI